MASYTIELRRVCELYGRDEVESWFKDYDLAEFLLPDQLQVVENSPLFSKDRLAKDIVNHYFMREIGFETPALFAHYAKVAMHDIMQEKLPLIYTNSIEYDPLVNVDYTETFNRNVKEDGIAENKNDGNSNSLSQSSSENYGINNETPQRRIEKQELDSGIFASNTSQNDNSSQVKDETITSNLAKTTSSSENKEEYIRHFKGNQGISASYQAMIKQFRENIIAIDKQIIEELNNLFMGLF